MATPKPDRGNGAAGCRRARACTGAHIPPQKKKNLGSSLEQGWDASREVTGLEFPLCWLRASVSLVKAAYPARSLSPEASNSSSSVSLHPKIARSGSDPVGSTPNPLSPSHRSPAGTGMIPWEWEWEWGLCCLAAPPGPAPATARAWWHLERGHPATPAALSAIPQPGSPGLLRAAEL